jgi:hypothetical protein
MTAKIIPFQDAIKQRRTAQAAAPAIDGAAEPLTSEAVLSNANLSGYGYRSASARWGYNCLPPVTLS